MRIALAQVNTTVGDLTGNCAKVAAAYSRAVAAGAGIVLAPELAVTGYPPRDLLVKRGFVEDNLRSLESLAAATGPVPLVAGYVEVNSARPGRGLYNAGAVMQDGRVAGRRFKTLLPTYDVFDEDRYFQPAASNEPLRIAGRQAGLTICEDVWTEPYLPAQLYSRDPIGELMRRGGIELLLNISASPYRAGVESARHDMLRAAARRHGVPLAYCNAVGGNDELIFDGQSMVFDAAGRLIACGAAFQEDLVIADVAAEQPALPFVPLEGAAAIHDALVLGLGDYARKCGFRSAVLGLSGGIDSAVTACLAKAALGSQNVVGVSMPSSYSSRGSVEDAAALARNLGIRLEHVPIQGLVEAFRCVLAPIFAGLPEDITEENIQARARGVILMALSNKFGHLLLTTGNKSEMAVGYCTLYGDMAGGLAVIADVPKTMVYELARHINQLGAAGARAAGDPTREAGFPIPEASLTKPPSAELKPNQTDQDTLPPYDILDAILRCTVEECRSAAETAAALGCDEALARSISRKIDLSEYKRKQAPPSLRVTTKAFGMGRRFPIAQRYVES